MPLLAGQRVRRERALCKVGDARREIKIKTKVNLNQKQNKHLLPVFIALGIGSISSSIMKGSGLGNTCTSDVKWPHLRTAWNGV